MKVQYKPGNEVSRHNIIFEQRYPMRAGKFPKDHPFSDNPEPFTFTSNAMLKEEGKIKEDRLSNFRQAGYWASCFPEGDGISFEPLKGQSVELIKFDIVYYLNLDL